MSLREIEYNKVDGFSKLLIDYVSNSDLTSQVSIISINKFLASQKIMIRHLERPWLKKLALNITIST